MMNDYYSIDALMGLDATFSISFGERSRGKTYSSLVYGIKDIVKSGYKNQMAYMRRWAEDMQGKRGDSLFAALVANNEIEKLTNGKYSGVKYYASRWYFTYKVKNKKGEEVTKKAENPFCIAFALNVFEHDKSSSFPDITTIIFDEFISRIQYIGDEFNVFLNSVNTITRHRNNVRVIMLGNTVSFENPYFHEMGVYYKAKFMKPGDTYVFKVGTSETTIALEFTSNAGEKPSDVYFNFETSSAEMIKNGAWEIGKYPRLPSEHKFKPKDIVFKYFILVYDEILQANIIRDNAKFYTYIHRKTTDLKDIEHDIIYSFDESPLYNWRCDILRPFDDIGKRIAFFFKAHLVFYQSNEVGELVNMEVFYGI